MGAEDGREARPVRPRSSERAQLTLADILALEALRHAEPEIVAGAEHLDRVVRWVHISEQPDIADYLKGGELLLTTGMGLDHDAQACRRFVRSLAEAGTAGVLVRLGGAFTSLPPEFLDEAQALALPLVVLHRRIGFVEVTEQVHGAIISKQLDMLRRAEDMRRHLTEMVLGGASLQNIVGRLADLVGNAVVLDDAAHQVVEFALLGREPSKLLDSWAQHSRTGHASVGRTVQRERTEPGCAWVAIWLRDELWGRVHLLATRHQLDDFDLLALDRAAAGIGLALLADHDARASSDQARSLLLADLLSHRLVSAEEFLARARSLGVDLAGDRLAALALSLADQPGEARPAPERDLEQIRPRLLEHVRAAVRAQGCEALAALDGDRVLAILRMSGPRSARELLAEIARDACNRVSLTWPGLVVPVVGVSQETSAQHARQALRQATEAAAYGARVSGEAAVHHYDDLGVYHLLLHLAEGPELASYVEAELGPLLHHDAHNRATLLPTLRSFLDHGGGASASARELFIERRTLYHRLTAIEALLGRDLAGADTRLRLGVALRALDLLRGPARHTPHPPRPGS
jgi:PucR family transcriptional regulator, purine catabolism regulatory protein